jgi:dipeptidase D
LDEIKNLKPSAVWNHFSNLCAIPHTSGNEQEVADYVKNIGKTLGLEVKTDTTGNVLISKKGSRGKENANSVVLQCHLDMVPQKNSGTIHDFYLNPILPFIDGEWVKAKGTTLGADNGLGVSIALAILESNLPFGPIESLFTIDEETGMTGAMALAPDFFKSKLMINLDTEQEGELVIGCAGGVDLSATINLPYEKVSSSRSAFNVVVKGLRGGHSGLDINLGRANAIKLMNRYLFTAIEKFDIRICGFQGGSARNAIPREAFATFVIPSVYQDDLYSFTRGFEKTLRSEHLLTDPDIRIELSATDLPSEVISAAGQDNFLKAIYACPNGVFNMNYKVPGVVETSGNLAIIDCKENAAKIHCLLRSSVESEKEDLSNAVLSALSLGEAHVELSGGYPGWEPDPDSSLLKTMKSVYSSLYGKAPEVIVVHAGLECGIIGSKYPGLDMVSCGPTIKFPHSPEEKAHIGSVGRFWDYLIEVLKRI